MKLPFWATRLTVIGLCILCGLGTWQIKRLTWKNDVIAQLNKAYENAGNDALDLEHTTDDKFIYGRVSGTFMPDKALLLGPRTSDDKIGNDLLVPLKIGARTLLINMGWTQHRLNEQPISHLQGENVWFEGLVRAPKWNSFTPENIPEKGAWYKADIKEIADAKSLKDPFPIILRAENASHKFDAAFPNNQRLYPDNNHMQYAFFWFAMAGALISVYTARFIIKQKR